jgi:hypothetical protein
MPGPVLLPDLWWERDRFCFEYFSFPLLTLNLLRTTIVAPPSNASKWQMGFNSAFKGLISFHQCFILIRAYTSIFNGT